MVVGVGEGVEEGEGGPVGRGGGDVLVFVVGGEVAVEEGLDGESAGFDDPGAGGVLVFEEPGDAFLVGGILGREHISFGKGVEGLAGGVGVAGHCGELGPAAVGALVGEDAGGYFFFLLFGTTAPV